jgi:small-conductance mechanosensitive channel
MVMATRGRTDEELWTALGNLDDDLLNLDLPESIVDEELTTLGIDPDELAKRGVEFVALAKEQERLAWQVRAQRNREQLQALATGSQTRVPLGMSRQQILARLDELRQANDEIGTAIKMAAHKRKAEESTDEELKALLEEMEALRAMERGAGG